MKQNDDEKAWDRRGFLQCMAWVGTGAMWTMAGGVLKGMPIETAARGAMGQERVVRTSSATLAVAVLSLSIWGCGSSNYTSSPSTPSPAPATVPATAVTIDVVAINGSQSFSPNPSTIPAGQMVVWHNVDTITHRVVFDDRSIDTGNLDPGAFSSPMFLEATGTYHCAIHPVMVGTIKGQ